MFLISEIILMNKKKNIKCKRWLNKTFVNTASINKG